MIEPAQAAEEDPAFLNTQLATCLGNKRKLLPWIDAAVRTVRQRLGGRRLRVLDAFAGSGAVSRLFKQHAERLVSNDLEDFAAALGRSFLANRSEVDLAAVAELAKELDARADDAGPPGFVEELYAPRDDDAIQPGERVFYTRANARRLDNLRRGLAAAPPKLATALLGPLLAEASVHANTAGVFKGFYKDRRTGVGRFGGTNADALGRIRGRIELTPPILSRGECPVEVLRGEALAAARACRGFDLAYFDPPYNQHPYGSNYFMLNLLATGARPGSISKTSGIPADWRRSDFNVRRKALPALRELCAATDASFLLVSFNDEGFVPPADLRALLAEFGRVEAVEIPYATYRGSRNLSGRALQVVESLLLVERR